MTPETATGFQPWLFEGDVSDINFVASDSNGNRKAYPFGSSCFINGREIPCFVFCNETGTMMSKILVDIFKHIDMYYPYDQR